MRLDADHLAAISTIVTERRSLLSASLVGALWGFGHTLALLVAGVGVLLLMSALVSLPARLTVERFARTNVALRGLSGSFSVALGLVIVSQNGAFNRLFA